MKRLPQEILAIKREGAELPPDAIAELVGGITSGEVSDAQIAAFTMAVCCRGMSVGETAALTQAMRDSGTVLDFRGLDGPILDKHSTGGVGDKVSLVLAPLLAACGAFVPMISGRGLGHTGGTLDKLEAIPGFVTTLERADILEVVRRAGCAIVGPTQSMVPADRRMYAVRDVTATVEARPLITASILSKKLAAGLDALVMDVKTGSGAFLTSIEEARALAREITHVAGLAGLPTRALITDQNSVLGHDAGNAIEVLEAIDFLTGEDRCPRLLEVVLALAAELLVMGALAGDRAAAREIARQRLESGEAAERLARMVAAQKGPTDLLDRPRAHLELAPVQGPIEPMRPGFVRTIDVRRLGMAILRLGGGRLQPDERIDHGVGLGRVAAVGEAVGVERPLGMLYARTSEDAERARAEIAASFETGEVRVPGGPVCLETIGPDG